MELLTFKTEQTELGRMATVTILDDNGQPVTRKMDYHKAVRLLHTLEIKTKPKQERKAK
jgi:hypothetical protein